jgi:hypothetical protein
MKGLTPFVVLLTACGGSNGIPDILWLAPAANGFDVTLSDQEPFQY